MMVAVTLPTANMTPATPGAKATTDSRQDTGFSDAMLAAHDAAPAPSGGRAHISPIAARGSAGNTGEHPDLPPRDGAPQTPPRAGLAGLPRVPADPVGRLPQPRAGGPHDPLRAQERDADADDDSAAGAIAGLLPMWTSGAAAPLAENAEAVGARSAREAVRRTGAEARGNADRATSADRPDDIGAGDARAGRTTRKPADRAAPAGTSRFQMQRLAQGPHARAQGGAGDASPGPAETATPARHLASALAASADAAGTVTGGATTHIGTGSAAATGVALFGLGQTTPAHAASNVGAAPPVTATLPSPVASAAWSHELGAQVVQMVQRGTGQIDLHLNPRELGPVQISLQLHDQTAQVHFLVAHADVQHAVQQAIPQLRDALAGQGIALGNALVGQQQQQPSGSFGGSPGSASWPGAVGDVEDVAPVRTTTAVLPQVPGSGVDLYA